MRNVSRRARFTSRPDHTIEVSETLGLGPIAPTDMAEIVSLAAFVESFSPADLPAYRLRSLGLRAMRNLPPDGAAALHLIALSESGTRRVKAALGAQPPQPLKAVSTMKGLLELAFPLSGEFDWLSIQIDSSAPLHLPLPSVPDYLHTVLLYWNQRGELSLSRYLAPRRMDAARREALSRTRRRLDLAERFYRDGLMPHAARMLIPGNGFGPEKLVLGKWEDPVAGCLAGYLLLRLEPQGSPHLDTAAKALPTPTSSPAKWPIDRTGRMTPAPRSGPPPDPAVRSSPKAWSCWFAAPGRASSGRAPGSPCRCGACCQNRGSARNMESVFCPPGSSTL
jgi:hypothetical protein